MKVAHSKRKHALLSASGAGRWINCPPSARMEEKIPSSGNSSYAEEGTLAHEFADLGLRIQSNTGDVGKGSDYERWKKQVERLKTKPLYDPEMDDYVKVYTNYVLEQFYVAKKKTSDAVLKIEERTDFSYLVPEGFGTSDANVIADELLEIVDLKYGKGVKVYAKENSQLRLYALGLLRKFDLAYDITKVKMTIVQPRLDHIDSEVLTVAELQAWAEKVVKPSADQAYTGEGKCNPGSWCRWCKAKPVCRSLADHNIELAKKEFAEPRTLKDDELIEVYEQTGLLVDWATSVAEYLLDEALRGKAWPGYKLVEGRSNRKWANEPEAIKKLSENYEMNQIVNTKIKGIGDIEKLVGKGKVNDLLIKPPGKPTLVPESDKRPAFGIEQAKKDFQE